MRLLRVVVIGVLALCGSAASAFSQMCGMRPEIAAGLKSRHKEIVGGIGLAKGSTGPVHVIEVFVSAGGSFTIVRTMPNNQACIIGAGTDWEFRGVPKVYF